MGQKTTIEFFSNLVKTIKSENELENEIKLLKNMFGSDKDNIKEMVDNLYLLKKKEDNITKLTNLINLIDKLNCIKTQLYNNLRENLNYFKKDNLKIQDFVQININIKNLNLKILENEKYFNVLNELMDKKELLDFLMTKKYDDIRLFIEFFDDLDSEIIQLKDISSLEKCVLFVENLKKPFKKDDNDLVNNFINLIDYKFKDIFIYLENINTKISNIIEGYNESLNDDERTNKIIEYIYKNSTFTIECQNYQYYDCYCLYKNKNKGVQKTFEDIILLKEKALLRKKQDNQDKFFDICQNFSINVNKINDIIKKINAINAKGFPEKLEAKILIENGKENCKINKFEGNLDKTIEYLDSIINDVKKYRKEYNLKNEYLRLIYGKQMSEIYRYLNDLNKQNETDNLKYLNKYLTNNKINSNIPLKDYNFEVIAYDNPLKTFYENCILYIEQLYKVNNLKISNIYQNQKLIKKYQGIYTFISLSDLIETNVILIYKYLTGNFPISQTILFCNQETSKEEIFTFLNRAVLSKENILFSIIKPEILEIETSSYLLDVFNDLLTENQNFSSTILFVYSEKNNSLINQIKKKEIHKRLIIDKFDETIKLKDKNNIKIYLSDVSGRGKSMKIYNDFNQELKQNYEYIYFPIGGDITRDEILNRLIDLKNKNVALHIDLLETNKIDLIRDFLFSFLIIKCYSKEENIFYFGDEIKIKIEIPNSFEDYFTKFSILNFFEIYKINQNNIEPLLVSQDITSNIQIVANYLKLKNNNNIDNKGLFFPNLHYTDETLIQYQNVETIIKENDEDNAVVLSQKECETLIDSEIKKYDNDPTYYQKKTFIDVLANQLILFTKDFYIKVELLKNNQINGIRSIILNSIIDSTQHFIKNAYHNILIGQKDTYKALNGIYNEEEANKIANENLAKKEIVSFEVIKPSLVFINEDQMSFSIITNCEKNSVEYQTYKKLINSGFNTNHELVDYKILDQFQFLDEVAKIFNIPPNISYELILDKIGSYVFTADNFIKLILILLRIRAKIPVILMGETGCGKTSLIRIISSLSELKNSEDEERKMKILNIHAGITDIDIINWIKNNNLLEKKGEKINDILDSKIWVFFDEINTCNSMGLISEILCKHSMQGKKLKSNVIFIAACNPYRKNTQNAKKREVIGLIKKDNIYKRRNLVYTVNPLPFSLINFVFDFGNLTSNDEEKYIKCILSVTLKNQANYEKNLKLGSQLIIICQNFIRELNDISSVSLREIRRFVILYEWFLNFLQINKESIYEKSLIICSICYIINNKRTKLDTTTSTTAIRP